MIFKLIGSLFLIIGIVFVMKLTPRQISDDILKFTSKRRSLRDQAKTLRDGKKKKSIGDRLKYIQSSLESMGKANQFAFVVCGSMILLTAGAVTAILIDNIFLIPVFSFAFAMIPFIYVRNSLARYDKHVKEELETSLSIITTSYIRNADIVAAVRENLGYIRPPLKEHFSAFITDSTLISGNVQAIKNLRTKVDDSIFREWCDVLIQCQDDNTIRDTLQPIVDKLADVRQVNTELSSMMASVRMEYYTMVGMVVGNIPLLYVLNKDWFRTLVYETCGKITLGICGIVILITYLFMLKFTKPIEYKG